MFGATNSGNYDFTDELLDLILFNKKGRDPGNYRMVDG